MPDINSIPDAVPRAEPRSRSGNPPFYEVLGQRYTVLGTAAGYEERGVASWYGPNFHGKPTSSGEIYDMYAMTAAHKTLPLPCYARITNLQNGHSVVVRINDRGPFVANRIIDLSYTAAARLDMLKGGTAFVEVRTLTPATEIANASAPPPIVGTGKSLTLQVGAYADVNNAERVLERLRAAGIANAYVVSAADSGRTTQRVRIGPLATVAEFDRVQLKLNSLALGVGRLVNEP